MNNKNIKELIEYPKKGIVSKSIMNKGNIDITLFCMAKNTDISEHTSTKKGIIYVVEGNGVFYLEKSEIRMQPEVIIFMKENAIHSLKAKENTSFILILIEGVKQKNES